MYLFKQILKVNYTHVLYYTCMFLFPSYKDLPDVMSVSCTLGFSDTSKQSLFYRFLFLLLSFCLTSSSLNFQLEQFKS